MTWEHFEIWKSGSALALHGKQICTTQFELGTVTTGRQRVFAGYFVRITMPEGTVVTGRDSHGISAALRATSDSLKTNNITLKVAGLDPDWYETGLSFNSTKGYIDRYAGGALFMMDPPPAPERCENDEAVNRLIREAVDGMFIRK